MFAPSPIPAPKALDVDGDGAFDPLVDGILIVRYLAGVTGNALVAGVGAGGGRSASDIVAHLTDHLPLLDVDGDGRADAFTDGVLILRYLFGLRGSELVEGIDAPNAIRNAEEIEAWLQPLLQ